MQIAGACLQFLGAMVTALGLLYAWDRASGKVGEWRNDARVKLGELRAQMARQQAPHEASVTLKVTPSLSAAASVDLTQTGTIEERLHRAENKLATLPGEVGKAIQAALDGKLGEFDAMSKTFAVKDISVALAGITMTAIGVLLSLAGMLR